MPYIVGQNGVHAGQNGGGGVVSGNQQQRVGGRRQRDGNAHRFVGGVALNKTGCGGHKSLENGGEVAGEQGVVDGDALKDQLGKPEAVRILGVVLPIGGGDAKKSRSVACQEAGQGIEG